MQRHLYENQSAALAFAHEKSTHAAEFLDLWTHGDWDQIDKDFPEWREFIASFTRGHELNYLLWLAREILIDPRLSGGGLPTGHSIWAILAEHLGDLNHKSITPQERRFLLGEK